MNDYAALVNTFYNDRFANLLKMTILGVIENDPSKPNCIWVPNEYVQTDYPHMYAETKYHFWLDCGREGNIINMSDNHKPVIFLPDHVNLNYSIDNLVRIFTSFMVARYEAYYEYFVKNIQEVI